MTISPAHHSGYHSWRQKINTWIFLTRGAEAGEVFLKQRRVFILPTRRGFLLALMLLALLLGSINYALALGYALTFLVTGIALVGMLATFRNLAHLSLRPGKVEPVFAGDIAAFQVVVINRSALDRYALGFRIGRQPMTIFVDAIAHRETVVTIPVQTTQRGWLAMPRLRLESVFPLGLWRTWSDWQPALSVLVYPQPAAEMVALAAQPSPDESSPDEGGQSSSGCEDFAGIRAYVAGDAPHHLAWKAMARQANDQLLSKLFDGTQAHRLWLSLAAVPPHLSLEEALSLLTSWVLECERRQLAYGLQLNSVVIPPGYGAGQGERCLTALALFE